MASLDIRKISEELFNAKIASCQIEGLNVILDEYNRRGWEERSWLAYILATVYHETAKTMQPIEEYGKGKGRMYGKKVKMNGEPYIVPDKIYYGRGYTQTTWYDNYLKLTTEAKKQGKDLDFLNRPELLLQPEPSIWATFEAMSKGWYTGKRLVNYLNDVTTDFVNARKIINGLDKAELISGYAEEFYSNLK
jgi:hypothetical protein